MVLTHRMLAGAILAVGLTLTGCSSDGDRPAPPAADSGAALNSATAQSVVDAIVAADLAAPNAHDDTAQRCPKIGCLQAVTTDTVTVLKFPSTGTALRHLGQLPDGYGIGTVYGADCVPNAAQGWDWQALTADLPDPDYVIADGVVTILGDAAARRIIRIGWIVD